ncbi:MAG TPA: AI-2E family transporter [Ktedonobacterales bacterium]|nr:AI-2E family transporter [Ktedonobacterales bacterium]
MTRDLLDRHRALRVLLALLLVIVAIVAASLIWNTLVLFGDVILLFFLAWIVAFVLEPVSILLQRRGLPRTLAVALIYLALLVVVSGGIVLAVPSIVDEVRLLASEITTALSTTNVNAWNTGLENALRHFGLSQKNAESFVNSLSSQVPGWAQVATTNAVNATTQLVTSILTVLFDTFLVLILSFYMMLDGDRLVESFVVRLPPAWIPDVRLFQQYVERIFGGFFRAQLTIGAIYGVLTWIVLALLGQANGLLVALLAGVIMLLPFIGPFLAVIPPVLLVVLQSPPNDLLRDLIIIVIWMVVAQQIVFQLIAPRVFGATMGVHPLLLFAGLLIGAKVGGVWGAFFAAPIVAVVYAMLRTYYDRFAQSSPLFKSVQPQDGMALAGQTSGENGQDGHDQGAGDGTLAEVAAPPAPAAAASSPLPSARSRRETAGTRE